MTIEGDLAARMVEDIDRFLTKQSSAALARREDRWKRDFSSREAREKSLAPNRHRLRDLIGVVNSKRLVDGFVLDATTERPSLAPSAETYENHVLHWRRRVFERMRNKVNAGLHTGF